MPVGITNSLGNFVTSMTRPDNMAPIWASEGLCVAGRTRMANKRGGRQEARERVIEELIGTFTWLYGARGLNWCGDKILDKILQNGGVRFDVGSDIMRRPFDNFMMKKSNYPSSFSAKKISILKGTKVMSAIVLANLFVGFAVPKFNQALSRKLKNQDTVATEAKTNKQSTPSFTSLKALNTFTNIIENTNTGKLVATDVGIAGGRALNARRPEETLDVAVRDIGSMYFYYWARGHAGNVMNLIETGGKTAYRLDPQSVNCVTEYLEEFLNANSAKMSVEEFAKKMFGEKDVKLPEGLVFEKEAPSAFENFMTKCGKKPTAPIEATTLENFLSVLTPEEKIKYENIAIKMSELQPKREGVSILSKNQIVDILSGGEMNSPKFLHKLFEDFTAGEYKNEYKYISHKKLYEHKDLALKYVEDIIKNAKDREINSALLKSVKNKNLMFNGVNFLVGFSFAVAFLSTLIPKLQYYITQKVTGKEGFPGSDDFGKNLVA